jgi:DNA gyrase subunit B
VYKTSGGLHGVGVTAVNALSSNLKVFSRRDGKTEYLEFERGKLIDSYITHDLDESKKGTEVIFTPDEQIFQDFTHFKIDSINNRLKELAHLNPKIYLEFNYSQDQPPRIFHYSEGLPE